MPGWLTALRDLIADASPLRRAMLALLVVLPFAALGAAWFWFIDAFAVACIIFTLTGLLLLQLHARHRPSTWPLVATSLLVPLLLAMFLIH